MNNTTKLNFFDTFSDLTYNKSNVDLVTDTILDYHEQFPNNDIFKVVIPGNSYIKQKIFALKHLISVHFHDKVYPVTIIIYLMNDFPNTPPEVYLDRSIPNIGVNPKYLNSSEINGNTFKISNNYLISWNRNSSSLKSLIVEIENTFNSVFPVYKNKENEKNINANLLACFNLQERYQIAFGMCETNTINNQIQEQKQKFANKTYSDEEIRELYLKELFNHLKPLLSEKYDKIKSDEDVALGFKNTLQGGVESMAQILGNKGEFIKRIDNSIYQLNMEVTRLKDSIGGDSKTLDFNNIQSMLEISNEKIIQAVAIEANIEELLLIVKKAYERQVLQIEETISFIRSLSRQSFKMKSYREKLMSS